MRLLPRVSIGNDWQPLRKSCQNDRIRIADFRCAAASNDLPSNSGPVTLQGLNENPSPFENQI